MTKAQKNNKEKALDWLYSLNNSQYEKVRVFWMLKAWERNRDAEKTLKKMCREGGISYKYINAYLSDVI